MNSRPTVEPSITPGPARSLLGLPRRLAVALLFLSLAAIAGYAALWRDAPIIQGDSEQYLEVARDLADGRLDRLHDRPPGYPLLLALTGSVDRPARPTFLVSLALHLASIWMLAAVLHAVGIPAAWLMVFCLVGMLPSYVEPAAHVMTETTGQFMLAAGFSGLMLWLTRRTPLALAVSGLAFGYATLTRPVFQALVVAMAACLFLVPATLRRLGATSGDAARATIALIAASVLLVGGFSWLNHARFGYFGISPLAGFHLSTKTILFVERLPDDHATVREILVRERARELVKRGSTHSGSQTIWEARRELEAATGLSTPALSRYLVGMNLTLIRRAPLEYLQDVAQSMAVYWFPAAGPLAHLGSPVVRWFGTGLHFLVVWCFFLQLVVLAGFAAADASRRLVGASAGLLAQIGVTPAQAIAFALAGVIVFYTMAVTCLVDIGEPRQRRTTDLLVLFMCWLGAWVWWRSLVGSRSAA
ncbi:MAG: hypothetical protein KJ066_23680 [Acidobacteria bacterium]|nr:hypothetical protein [Acidobacteriota bacterium]